MAQLAPTPIIASGEVLSRSVFTETNFFLSPTAFPISHLTHPLLCVFLPMMHSVAPQGSWTVV